MLMRVSGCAEKKKFSHHLNCMSRVSRLINFKLHLKFINTVRSYPAFLYSFWATSVIYINYLHKASSSWQIRCIQRALTTLSMARILMSVLKREKTKRESEKVFQYLLSAPQDVLKEEHCFESL
jgi:hypothetical protein